MDRGSVLVFLNGPKNRLEFSLNGVFGRTGTKFDGFYLIPENEIHFVSYRLASAEGGEGAFVTLILCPAKPKVFVFDWNCEEELFKLKHCDHFSDGQTDKLLEYPGLISYQRFTDQQEGSVLVWKTFTRFINKGSIRRIFKDLGQCKELEGFEDVFEVTPMIESHHSLLEGIDKSEQSVKYKYKFKFLEIPSMKTFTRDPKLITQCALDRSVIFKSLNVNFSEVISELQISFLLLSFGQNFEGFEQWMDLVTLALQSFDLAQTNPKEFKIFLSIMREHLEMCPDDFFSGLMNENKLYKLLLGFFSNTNNLFEDEIQFYEQKFGWNFECEDPEDGPVIVE